MVIASEANKAAALDELTALPKRNFMKEWLESQLPLIGEPDGLHDLVVAFIDLDRFKQVNDNYSHAIGDKLLIAVVKEFLRHLGLDEQLGRIGGDEFLLVLPNQDDVDNRLIMLALELNRKLLEVEPGLDFLQPVSIGYIQLYRPGGDVGLILRKADAAMYEAKHGKSYARARVVRYYEGLLTRLTNKQQRRTELRRHLKTWNPKIRYMPIVKLNNGRTVGYESLLYIREKWAEGFKTEEIVEILDEIQRLSGILELQVERACRLVSQLAKDDLITTVSVNVTAAQMSEHEFVQMVQTKLQQHDIAGSCLTFEVTEGQRIYEPLHFGTQFQQLQTLGCGIVIDDFGLGNSDLQRLRDYTWTGVKLSSLGVVLNSSGNTRLAKAIVGVAKAAGATVTVEWIRTAKEEKVARRIGCNFAQGECYAEGQTHLTEAAAKRHLRASTPQER